MESQAGHRGPQGNEFRVVKNRNRAIVRWQVEASFNPARQTITPEVSGFAEFDAWGEEWGDSY